MLSFLGLRKEAKKSTADKEADGGFVIIASSTGQHLDSSMTPRVGCLGRAHGLHLDCALEGTTCRALVDTRSTISLVRPGILLNSIRQLHRGWSTMKQCITTVTGDRAKILGTRLLQVMVGCQQTEHNFWLADIQDPSIISLALMDNSSGTASSKMLFSPRFTPGWGPANDQSETFEEQRREKQSMNIAHPSTNVIVQPPKSFYITPDQPSARKLHADLCIAVETASAVPDVLGDVPFTLAPHVLTMQSGYPLFLMCCYRGILTTIWLIFSMILL
ncbi:hypothetical protein INR49_000459 [Caranx melampygus]|nr:hypothetical protein INR49_000459 [Caranx melampygus]